MKKTIITLFAIATFFACNRDSASTDLIESIIGTYSSTDPTTNTTASDAIVSVSVINSNFIKITYNRAPYAPSTQFVFDSVKLFNDRTFTVNQIFQNPYNNGASVISTQAVGTGNFGTNTINFRFTCTNPIFNYTLLFNGVR